jgi:hypothetical protein
LGFQGEIGKIKKEISSKQEEMEFIGNYLSKVTAAL